MFCFFKRLTILAIVGMTISLVWPQHAKAQAVPENVAATPDSAIATPDSVEAILASLEKMDTDSARHTSLCDTLTGYPDGGETLAALVRRLVLALPKLASDFIDLASCANEKQKTAIGTGLGQATSAINEKDAEAATAIAQLVAAGNDKIIQTAFVAAVGDGTAAVADGTQGTPATVGAGQGTTGGTISGTSADSLAVQSSGGGSGGGDSVSPGS